MAPPKTLDELFEFYYDTVKLLYGIIQSANSLPQEVLFEINAAFDHVSRIWYYKDPVDISVEKAYSHLKRSCLDIYKLLLREAIDRYKELLKIDTSLIDNGNFDSSMHALMNEIKKDAATARKVEGKNTDEAFSAWTNVYNKCFEFEQNFYLHKSISWAQKKTRLVTFKYWVITIIISLLCGFASGYLVNLVYPLNPIPARATSFWDTKEKFGSEAPRLMQSPPPAKGSASEK